VEGVGPQGAEAGSPSGGGWRAAIERGFEAWGFFVCRWRWPVLVTSLLVTAICASFVPGVTVDNSTEALLLSDDPEVVTYNAFRDEFSRDDRILVAVEAPDLFGAAFLERLRALHRAIEAEVPYIEEVESLVNARLVRGVGDELIVGELLEDWPDSEADRERARALALANPLYQNALIGRDRTVTALAIKPFTFTAAQDDFDALSGFDDEASSGDESVPYLTAPESDELMAKLLALVERHERDDFRLYVAGALPMTYRMNQGLQDDLGLLMPVTLLVMGIVLGVLFRRVGAVVLPLLIVVLSLVTTIGIMVMLGIPGSSAIQILPIFLLTVGVCDAVHILTLTYRYRAAGQGQHEAIAHALGHSGLAVWMTSLTTAAGMSSFAFAKMAAIVHLGFLAPLGVMLAFVYTVTLLPALLAIFPLRAPRGFGTGRRLPFEGFLVAAGDFATRAPWRVLLPTALLAGLMVLGAMQVSFSHNGLLWFPEDDGIRRDFEFIDDTLGGSVSVDVVIDAREPGGLYEPELLRRIERIVTEAQNLPAAPLFIVKGASIVDIVQETHQALSGGGVEMRRIPGSRQAVAQELLLFENSGSDDTAEFVDSEYRRARINLRVPFVDALLYPKLLDDLDALVAKRLEGTADYEITGLMTLLARIFEAVIESMMRSYIFALLVITPLMMLLLGSLRRGLVSMVPNLLPVLATLGVMGWAKIPADSTTILIGAMVIGLAVDDTIHFMHKFQGYFEAGADLRVAVRETLRTTGSALLFTSLVIAGGFMIFTLSEMSNMRAFGMLAALASVVAFAADLLVAPALLTLVERTRRQRAVSPPLAEPQPAVAGS